MLRRPPTSFEIAFERGASVLMTALVTAIGLMFVYLLYVVITGFWGGQTV